MSFSSDVKNELVSLEMVPDCCKHAESYGMLLFGRSFATSSVCFAAENRTVCDKYAEVIENVTGNIPVYEEHDKMTVISVRTMAERKAVLGAFGHAPNEFSLRINRANLESECCQAAFIRGAFLSCGTVGSPEKNYHLEFVIPFLKLSGDLFTLLQELGLQPKKVVRKGYHVIYFKDSENIEDVLTLMGATNSTLKLIGVKINKDMRNRINRRINFETANIDRAVNAGTVQLEAIRKIERISGLDSLPDGLRETAQMRLDNPEASLNELEELFEGRLSRSGINHRLTRLVKLANEL